MPCDEMTLIQKGDKGVSEKHYGPAFTSLNFLSCAYPMKLLREKLS